MAGRHHRPDKRAGIEPDLADSKRSFDVAVVAVDDREGVKAPCGFEVDRLQCCVPGAAWGLVGAANYAAAKAGMLGLRKSLAQEWDRYASTSTLSLSASSRLASPSRNPTTR